MNAGETATYLAWLKVTLPVMEAFAKGEEIQSKSGLCLSSDMEWVDLDDPYWGIGRIYRIKPKPMERWAVVNPEGFTEGTYGSAERAKQIAIKYGYRVVHMREVMED